MRTATARMLVRRGREADAVAQLERAGPEDDGAAMMLAAIHANAGRFDDAVRILDALLARRPEHPRARQQRAIVERMRASR
jgi:Flp pilus assembly protein TadD